jgi:hypothetical protein
MEVVSEPAGGFLSSPRELLALRDRKYRSGGRIESPPVTFDALGGEV